MTSKKGDQVLTKFGRGQKKYFKNLRFFKKFQNNFWERLSERGLLGKYREGVFLLMNPGLDAVKGV